MTYQAEAIQHTERLSRFAFEKGSYYRPSDRSVRPKAFEPMTNIEKARLEVSVSRTDDLNETGIWALGDEAGALRNVPKSVVARCDLQVSQVNSIGLIVLIDEPPARHSVIVEWPEDESLIMQKQQELAAAAGKAVIR